MQSRQLAVRNVTCGENVVIYELANLYNCTLGDNVFVGLSAEIQGNMQIGADNETQSHTFICEYVTLGARRFIDHDVVFANDMFREGEPNADCNSWGGISTGNDVSVDSGVTILAVTICDGAVIGAGSVVIELTTEKGMYTGNPIKLLCRL